MHGPAAAAAVVEVAAVAAVAVSMVVVADELAEVHDLAAAVDFMVVVGDLEVEVLLDARHQWGAQAAVVAGGLRSTYRVAVDKEWEDFRRQALVEVDGLAVDKLHDPAVALVPAAGRLRGRVVARVPAAVLVPVADKLHDRAVVRDPVEEASRVVVRRSVTSTTS
jgi:hypothetical protein